MPFYTMPLRIVYISGLGLPTMNASSVG